MRTLWLGVVLTGAICCATAAQGRARHQDWAALQQLGAGESITVRSVGQTVPDRCLVETVDDASLSCSAEDGRATRLVFPRSEVSSVWVAEPAREHHVGLWIAVGAGTALGAALCSPGGARAALFCAALGAGTAGGLALNPPPRPMLYPPFGYPPVPPMQQGPLLRMRLVYRAPVVQPATP